MLIKKMVIFVFVGVSFISANNAFSKGLSDIVDFAENEKAEKHKVLNYLFKQRMRTQLIARDALLISIDFNSTHYQKEILESANAFNENFFKFIKSTEEINQAKKLYPDFAKKVNDLNQTWLKFYESVKKISKNSKDKKSMEYIENNNLRLLDDISYIFTSFMNSYQSTDKLEASMAHIKSVLFGQVGKPRLYMNEMVKDKLSIEENIHKEKSEEDIKDDILKMDKLMNALKNGDKELELSGTEDRAILEKLAISQKLWEEAKKLLIQKKLTKSERETLIAKNNLFLKAQTEVVKLIRLSNDN